MKIYYEINACDYKTKTFNHNIIYFDKEKDHYSINGWVEENKSGYYISSEDNCCQVQLGYNNPITWNNKTHNICIIIDDDINNAHLINDYKSFRTFWEKFLGIDKEVEIKQNYFEILKKQLMIEQKKNEINKDFNNNNENYLETRKAMY